MKPFLAKVLSFILLASLIPFQTGCTKEKAEALKTAAKDFRTQASVAIDKLDRLLVDDVAFAPLSEEESRNQIVESLKTGAPGVTTIRVIVNRAEPEALDTSRYKKKLGQIRKTYEDFESMFDDLPRGHYFAGDAVAKSEALARKLVAQMIFLGKHVQQFPFKLNARIELAEQMREKALAETDSVKRENAFTVLATEIRAIRRETKIANDAAILECAKGAEIGLRVVQLIRTYKKLSVNDILAIVRDGLGKVNLLTGKNTDVLMKRIEEIHGTILNDAEWAAIYNAVTTEMNSV